MILGGWIRNRESARDSFLEHPDLALAREFGCGLGEEAVNIVGWVFVDGESDDAGAGESAGGYFWSGWGIEQRNRASLRVEIPREEHALPPCPPFIFSGADEEQ